VEGSGCGLFWKLPSFYLEWLKKTTKQLDRDGQLPDRDLNPKPSEYEAGMCTITLFRFVFNILFVERKAVVAHFNTSSRLQSNRGLPEYKSDFTGEARTATNRWRMDILLFTMLYQLGLCSTK
jgi:hypothetical protein